MAEFVDAIADPIGSVIVFGASDRVLLAASHFFHLGNEMAPGAE
ncbi:hypothetical protein [Achromobacter kerstersii]